MHVPLSTCLRPCVVQVALKDVCRSPSGIRAMAYSMTLARASNGRERALADDSYLRLFHLPAEFPRLIWRSGVALGIDCCHAGCK